APRLASLRTEAAYPVDSEQQQAETDHERRAREAGPSAARSPAWGAQGEQDGEGAEARPGTHQLARRPLPGHAAARAGPGTLFLGRGRRFGARHGGGARVVKPGAFR